MLNKLLLTAAAAVLIATTAQAADIAVSKAWSRPAAQGGTGAGYLTVDNAAAAADTLLSATTPAAAKVEMHQSMVMDGMAMMHAVPEGVTVPANGKAVLVPGGYHFMLIGLKAASKAGDSIPLTLTFAKAGTVKVDLAVRTTPP